MALPGRRRIVFVIVVILLLAGSMYLTMEQYKRGQYYDKIYNNCIKASSINGLYTQYDAIICGEFVERAKNEHWYEEEK